MALSSRSFDRWYLTLWHSFAAPSDDSSAGGTSCTRARPDAVDRADDVHTLWQVIVRFPFTLSHLHIQASLPRLSLWWRSHRASSAGGSLHTGDSPQRSRPVVSPAVALFNRAPRSRPIVPSSCSRRLFVLALCSPYSRSPKLQKIPTQQFPLTPSSPQTFDQCLGRFHHGSTRGHETPQWSTKELIMKGVVKRRNASIPNTYRTMRIRNCILASYCLQQSTNLPADGVFFLQTQKYF